MPARSLNKVQLIGNLTRDPELRYTPQGTAVCTLGIATNRYWVTESGEKREETEFHRVVAWNKLAELCAQLLFKGRKVFVEGRLQTREWTGKDGATRQTTEIVISDMIILDSKRAPVEEATREVVPEGATPPHEGAAPFEEAAQEEEGAPSPVAEQPAPTMSDTTPTPKSDKKKKPDEKKTDESGTESEEVKPEDIPF